MSKIVQRSQERFGRFLETSRGIEESRRSAAFGFWVAFLKVWQLWSGPNSDTTFEALFSRNSWNLETERVDGIQLFWFTSSRKEFSGLELCIVPYSFDNVIQVVGIDDGAFSPAFRRAFESLKKEGGQWGRIFGNPNHLRLKLTSQTAEKGSQALSAFLFEAGIFDTRKMRSESGINAAISIPTRPGRMTPGTSTLPKRPSDKLPSPAPTPSPPPAGWTK